MKMTVLAACLALVPLAAHADAISDQKKAYESMGIKIPHPPAMCGLITKSEASRFLGVPVGNGESAGALSGCAYRAVGDRATGVLVTRGSRSDWYPVTSVKQFAYISGVGERAYVDYNDGLGYEATALTKKGVTSVQLAGKGNARTAIALLKLAMNR